MFLESPRFPECVSFGAIGGPGWQTDIVQVASGFETRNRGRQQSLGRWEVAHAARRPAEWKPLRAFWMTVAGQFAGFRFKDHLDDKATGLEGIFSQITSTTFQMHKRYQSGGSYHDRKIQKPVTGTVVVTGGTVSTINYTTGIVTMTSGTPTRWTGEFDVPCRFGTDELTHEAITKSMNPDTGEWELLVDWRSIPIAEIRV